MTQTTNYDITGFPVMTQKTNYDITGFPVFFPSENQMDSALHTCSLIKTLAIGQNVVTNCKTLDQNVLMSIG